MSNSNESVQMQVIVIFGIKSMLGYSSKISKLIILYFYTTTKRWLLWNKKNGMIVISLLFHSLQSQYNGRRNPHSRISNQKRWSWAYKNSALQFINHISINETNCNTRCALQSCAKCFILLYFIRIKISLWALKRLK